MPLTKGRVFLAVCLTMFLVGGNIFAQTRTDQAGAKYIFLFIGDGMGVAQRHAAELFVAAKYAACRPEEARLVMNSFPAQGLTTTYDLTGIIPDSASTATAMACGRKTRAGIVGMDPEGRVPWENIAETAKKHRWKVGILSTVSLDHATPAAFYAHVPHRNLMSEISRQLAESGMDYFAGGQLLHLVNKKDSAQPDAIALARQRGYTVAVGRAEFEALSPGIPKVIAMSGKVDQHAAIYYTLDQGQDREHLSLAEFLEKGIELLDNPEGFFIMAEGGKIDWACHANDAAAAIHDTLALDQAVAVAVRFYQKHPRETLIVVTGDHETGGLTIGFAGTRESCFIGKLGHQTMSHLEFDKKIAEYKKHHSVSHAKFEDLLPLITDAFGLHVRSSEEKVALDKVVLAGQAAGASPEAKAEAHQALSTSKAGLALSELELQMLQDAFQQSLQGEKKRARDGHIYLRFGGYEPLTVKLITILNNKAGIGWTTYSHSGVPVQTSALGVGADLFNGYYDQTQIYRKIIQIAGFAP